MTTRGLDIFERTILCILSTDRANQHRWFANIGVDIAAVGAVGIWWMVRWMTLGAGNTTNCNL